MGWFLDKDEILPTVTCGYKYLKKTSSESWNTVPSTILIYLHLFSNQFGINYISLWFCIVTCGNARIYWHNSWKSVVICMSEYVGTKMMLFCGKTVNITAWGISYRNMSVPQLSYVQNLISTLQFSMFHPAFFNSIIDKYQPMHFSTFNTILV